MLDQNKNTDQSQSLPNIPAVVTYLAAAGWKIKKSSAYQHVKEKKLLRLSDGSFSMIDAEKYACRCLKRLDGSGKNKSIDDMQSRKYEAEVQSAEYEARIKRIKAEAIEGKYVLKEIFEDELSVQALAFRNTMQTFVHTYAEEIIQFVSGDVSRIPDLISFMIEKLDGHFFKTAEELEAKGPFSPDDVFPDDDETYDDDDADTEEPTNE